MKGKILADDESKNPEKPATKPRSKKLYYVLLAILALFVLLILLLLYKPAGSKPQNPYNNDKVNKHLTHELAPQFYNGVQLQEHFELDITQKGVNDIILHCHWPQKFDSVTILPPKVYFIPDRIVLMGMVKIKDAKVVVTVVAAPVLDEKGLLNINIETVKIGAVNITFVAKLIAGKIWAGKNSEKKYSAEDARTKIFASILENKAIDPVFKIKDKKTRIDKITLVSRKLKVRLVPLSD